MRHPRFDGRAYDLVWKPNTDNWYIVFPNAKQRKCFRHFNFNDLPVTSVQSFLDSYVCNTEYVTNIGYRKSIPTRHRQELPRLEEVVMLGENCYGLITNINYREREIEVQFPNEVRYYTFGDFAGNWTDKHSGMWIMED